MRTLPELRREANYRRAIKRHPLARAYWSVIFLVANLIMERKP